MAMKGLMDGTDINFVNLAWLICLNLLEVPRIFQTHSYKKKKTLSRLEVKPRSNSPWIQDYIYINHCVKISSSYS